MIQILNSIHNVEHRLNTAVERLFFHHPYLGYLTVFIGMPIVIIAVVLVCTTIPVFLLSLIFNWM